MASTMTRWSPFGDLAELRTRLDRAFEDMMSGSEREWAPAIDLIEADDRLTLRANLPGIKPEDIKIEVEDDVLTVSGQHEERTEERKERYVRRERRYGGFSRSIGLPRGVSTDDVEATCSDGVLEVTVPLPREAEKKAVTIKPTIG